MKVIGYTNDKEIVELELTVDQIVDAEIDPWRIDLFDAKPVSINHDGKVVYFRRLSNIAFAYRTFGPRRLIIAMHDDTAGVCVEAFDTEADDSSKVIKARSWRFENALFKEHLRSYMSGQYVKWWAAAPARAVTFTGNSITFDSRGRYIGNSPFCGAMLEEVRLPVTLSTDINRAFEAYANWHPVVFGEALRKHLTGERVTHVDVALDAIKGGSPVCDGYVETSLDRTFAWNACRYRLHQRWGRLHPSNSVSDWTDRFTVNRLFSSRQNEVRGTRIELFDIGAHRARLLNNEATYAVHHSVLDRYHEIEKRRRELESSLFHIVQIPFRSQ